jgi:hypothetical protein
LEGAFDMKMENGATYGEFAVLRALKVKGGEAPFSELSRIHLRGIERLLCRMLPPRSRQKGVTGRQTMKGDRPRPALVQRRFVGSPPCDLGTIAFASHHAFF